MIKWFSYLVWLIRTAGIDHPYHRESIPFHSIEVAIRVALNTSDKKTRAAAWLHDLGKLYSCGPNHGEIGASMVDGYLRVSDPEIEILVKYHMLPSIIKGNWATPEQKMDAQEKLWSLPYDIQYKLNILADADGKATHKGRR